MTYFTEQELQCKCGCKTFSVGDGFIDHLNDLREAYGKPLYSNSCCRCKAHNTAIGGKPASFHLMDSEDTTGVDGCVAIDISIEGWAGNEKWRFVLLAMQKGWSVGVSPKGFIHLDRRADYKDSVYYGQPTLFNY